MRVLIGWGTAEMAGTKIIPLWVGARGVEFQWTNLQSALDANVSLVCLCVVGEMSSVSLLTASTSNLEGCTFIGILSHWQEKRYLV